jgi:hypothetical protein
MHHGIDVVTAENFGEQDRVAHIAIDEIDPGMGQVFKARDALSTAVAQIVEHQHMVSGVDELQGGMGTDVAGPASDQRSFAHDEVFLFRD